MCRCPMPANPPKRAKKAPEKAPKAPAKKAKVEAPDDPSAPPPGHLGDPGTELWHQIHRTLPKGWGFDDRELAVLALACEQADDLALIRDTLTTQGAVIEGSRGQPVANNLLTEARQARQTITRLLGQLALPDAEAKPATMKQLQGKEAAKKRKAMAEAWKARAAQARGDADG